MQNTRVTIPRHGAPLSAGIKNFNAKNDLPGGINVSLADGHAEFIRLEKLWQLYWDRKWVVPAKRPGK